MNNPVVKKILNEFEIYIGTVIFICLTILLTLQVISRYVFRSAWVWTEELAVIAFVWLIYLGVAGAVTKRKHLRIDALINVLPFKAKRFMLVLDNVICFVFCAGIILPFITLIQNQMESGAVTSLLRIPKSVTYMIIPFGMVITCIRLVVDTKKLMGESERELGYSKPTIDVDALEREGEALRRAELEAAEDETGGGA